VNSENVSISYVLPSIIIILFLWKRRRVYLVWFVLADIVYSPSILLIFHLEINIFLTNFIRYLYYLIPQSFMTLPYRTWGTSSLLLRWGYVWVFFGFFLSPNFIDKNTSPLFENFIYLINIWSNINDFSCFVSIFFWLGGKKVSPS